MSDPRPAWLTVLVLVAGPHVAHADDIGLGGKITRVELTSVSGSVRVAPAEADAEEIRLVTSERIDTAMCDLDVSKRKGAATVTFGPRSQAQPEQCSLDIELLLPAATSGAASLAAGHVIVEDGLLADLELTVTAGDLTVGSTSGALTAKVVAGDVRIDGATGPLDLEVTAGALRGTASGPARVRSGDGAVALRDLTAPVEVTSAVGHVQLTFAEVPTSGTVRAEASNGNVAIDLPGRPTVNCIAASTLGDAICDVPSSTDAPLTVHALTGTGSVRVF